MSKKTKQQTYATSQFMGIPGYIRHWMRATEKDGEEYKTKSGPYAGWKYIIYPKGDIDVYPRTKIWNFKTQKWDLYSELPEEQKDPRVVEPLSVTPEAREEAREAKKRFILGLENIKRL